MPNIIEYTSKSNITPSDKGINAAADAGRHYGRVANEIGRDINRGIHDIGDAVEKHMTVMETSELYKTGTELKLSLQKRYQEESALPENRNDPHFGDRFMAEVAPLLDEWGEGAKTDHGKMLAVTLKSGIRNEVFGHVAAGQAEMDAAHVDDNLTQTRNLLGTGLVTDPSTANLERTLGTMRDTIQGMTAAIPDVDMRERMASQMTSQFLPQLVAARYQGVAESIKNQISESGGETSPALEQLNKDIAAQVGFQYLSPDQQAQVSAVGKEAVHQGQVLFNSKAATAKAQMVEAGKADYAEIHNVMTNLALNGQGPTPELVAAAQEYARKYGASNPGEAASLDSFILSGQDRAQRDTVQPFNQQTRDNIQAGFSLPSGDPRRPTLASLTNAYSHGLITKEDFAGYTQILGKIDKPESDPSFKAAWEGLQRWQKMQAEAIGGANYPGSAAARARFIYDSTQNFMARGKASGDWERTLERVTDARIPGNFANETMIGVYKRAAQQGDAAGWLSKRWPQWNADNTLTWPTGTGGGRPAAPAAQKAAPAASPAADLGKADEFLWGKK